MKQFLLKTWLTMLCLLVFGSGTMWAEDVTFDLVTSASQISAGDRIIIVNSAGTKALSGISTTSTKYGTLADVTTSNNSITVSSTSGVEVFDVENGSTNGTFSFKGTSNISNYLYWTSGNSLNQNATKDAKSSWTIEISDAGVATIKNGNDASRVIRFNSDRFACYTTEIGNLVKVYKTGAATSGTITIDASKIASFAGSYSDRTWTSGGISGKIYAYRAGSSAPYLMQFNSTPYCYNTTAITGRIKSVKITKGGSNTQNWNVYVSNSPITNDNYTSATALSQNYVAVDESGHTFEVTNGNYTYFYIRKSSGSTQISSFEIEYEEAQPVGPAQISNLIKTSSANLYVGDEIADLNSYLNLPEDYEGTVTFSSEQDGTLVTLVDDMLSADAAGTATINVTAAAKGNYLETTGTITLNISKKTPVLAWTNGTKESYTIFNGKDYEFNSYPTAYITNYGPSTINYTISDDAIIIDGEPAWESAGTYIVTAQTAETDKYNASAPITYTINVVDPAITMSPESGTVSAENPTVTFTGNGVKIDYLDESANGKENNGSTISLTASKTQTYLVTITDDANNTFKSEFDVYYLQDAGLQFSANELRVLVGTTDVVEPQLTKATDATVTYELIYGNPEKGSNVATIDAETGELTLAGLSTETQGTVTVKATTPATNTYTAGEATYELVVYRTVPEFTWSATSVTIDQDELNQLPTPVCDRNVTSLTSSNTSVAAIVDGAVTFVGYGTTTITGKTSATADYAQATASYELTFAPRYTVTFNVKGDESELREATSGAGVTAPEVEDVADYTFAGWATATVAAETTDAQTFATITAGKYMPSANTTLYAVYKRVETAEGASEDEGEFLIYADVNGTKYYMTGKPVASASTVNQILVSTNKSEATVFTITKKEESDADYSIAYDDNGATMYLTHNTTGNYLQSSSTAVFFTFSEGAKSGTTRMLNSKRAIAFNNSVNPKVFKIFATANLTAESTQYYDPTLEQISGGSTTYYTSAPVLEVATINVSQFQNTTLCLSRAYTMPEGLVGKTVSASEGSDGNYTLTLTKKYNEGDVVPAGEALVVQGAQGTYTALAATTSAAKTAYPDNLLVAEYTPQDTKFLTSFNSENSGNYYYYKLTTKDGANFGWYYGAENGAPFLMASKERAYLVIAKDVANSIRAFRLEDLESEGTLTSIEAIEAQTNETIFNLQGQRMNHIQKGVNIVNGKKVLR